MYYLEVHQLINEEPMEIDQSFKEHYPTIEVAAAMNVSMTRVQELVKQRRLQQGPTHRGAVCITRASLVSFFGGEDAFKTKFIEVRKIQTEKAGMYSRGPNRHPILTAPGAALLCDLRPNDIHLLCEKGEIPHYKTAGRHRRISLIDLEKWYFLTRGKHISPLVLAHLQDWISTPASEPQKTNTSISDACADVDVRAAYADCISPKDGQ
jgi:hypothetical protein